MNHFVRVPFWPVIDVDAAIIGSTKDLFVILTEGDTEDTELDIIWSHRKRNMTPLTLIRCQFDAVKILTPWRVHKTVTSMTHCHIQHWPTHISCLDMKLKTIFIGREIYLNCFFVGKVSILCVIQSYHAVLASCHEHISIISTILSTKYLKVLC